LREPNRATTVLVEGIPGATFKEDGETVETKSYQTNDRVKEYFDGIFGSKIVETAYVVKVFPELSAAIKKKNAQHADVEKLHHKIKTAKDEDKEGAEKELKTAKEQLEEAEKSVTEERGKVDDEMNTSKAFVTFTSRREAELSKMIVYSPDAAEWVVSIAPDPSDILWADLQMDPT
jgi:hypothetical protein